MKFYVDLFFRLVTVVFFGWLGYRLIVGNEKHWRFGGDGIPESLIDWETRTYWDGSPVDPLTVKLVELGWEHDVMLILTAVIATLLIGNVIVFRNMRRARAKLAYFRNLNAVMNVQLIKSQAPKKS